MNARHTTSEAGSADEPIRAFIGTDDSQIVPAILLAETLSRSVARRAELETFFLWADRGKLVRYRRDGLEPVGSLPLKPHQRPRRSGTGFSLVRYCIPEIVGRWRALYFDSDQLFRGDILALWKHAVGKGGLALCRSQRRASALKDMLDTSVMVIDADRCQWQIGDILRRLELGDYDYWEVMCLAGRARELRGGAVSVLDPSWNTFDSINDDTQLVHYTTRETQPWKNDDLPSGAARQYWEAELARTAATHPFLSDYIRAGIAAGYLKAGLQTLLPHR